MRRNIAIILLLTLAACTGGKSCATKSNALPDAFVWGNGAEPPSLDPAILYDDRSFNIGMQLFEGLTEYHPETLEAVPGVASSWDISPDGLVWTFHLRNNAFWSDGSPVTAADFEYSWKRVLAPQTASQTAYMLYFIKNAENYNAGKTTSADDIGINVIDPQTLQITLEHPVPFFPQLVAHIAFRPVHRATVEQWGDQWTRPEHMVSNGPYRLTSWLIQREVVLEKNPNYWDKNNVRLAKVKFLPIEDMETALKMQLDGVTHYTIDIPPLKVAEIKGRPDLYQSVKLDTYFYQLNTKRKPFDDMRVRRALCLAIDRRAITETLARGDKPATSLTPEGLHGYSPPNGCEFNPDKAKALLLEAGFADPTTFPSFTILYNTLAEHKMVAELAQSMWKQNLGINVGIQNLEWKVLLTSYVQREFDIGRYTWIGDYSDPSTFLNIFASNSQQNYTNWVNPTYDDLVLNQAPRELNPEKRALLLKQAEEILLEEAPLVPIFNHVQPSLLDPRVRGFHPNILSLHPLKFAWFEEAK
ncbi:MAG: peptide ABC transporter substrate-binding protein [Deltaproteobacteria bacterium]|nr:peptide ABC transporter substrate-binding protein [Deltaproteobacteria bacterium]